MAYNGGDHTSNRKHLMKYFNLYRISSYLLILGALGHTFGGMLATVMHGRSSGPEADEVFSKMKSVHFIWQGAHCTWYDFWLGNGLSVSALLILGIVVLWVLGGLPPNQLKPVLPIAWAASISFALLCVLGFVYFAIGVGVMFGLIALLTGIATIKARISTGC